MKTFLKNILSTIIGMVSAVIVLILLFAGLVAMFPGKYDWKGRRLN